MKKWCKHISWADLSDRTVMDACWWLSSGDNMVEVGRAWKVCPICESPRPTAANKAGAELRAAMDNDQ